MAHIPTTFERKWPTVILTPIQVLNHVITVSSTAGLHTKQKIVLSKIGLSQIELEIKRVLSDTQIHVGPVGSDIALYSNPVAYDGGTLTSGEQERNKFGSDIVIRAVYEEEPAVALRNVLVNRYGAFYSTDNPLPVQLSDGSINIGSVNAELEVQLSHIDNDPDAGDVHDSVRIGDGIEQLEINPGGSINVNIVDGYGGTVTPIFNQITSVISNAWQTLVTYTVPVGKKGFLYRVNFGGDNIAEYEVLVNSVLISKARTWFSGPLFDKIEWSSPNGSGYQLAAGNVVTVRVQHWRSTVGTFEGTILMNIKDV